MIKKSHYHNLFVHPYAPFDCLHYPGGPFIVPTAFDPKFYERADILDAIEDGFYNDYNPIDTLEI